MNKDYSEQEALAMVKTIIAEETDENPESITQEMTLARDLDMDANSIEQVLTACEVEFGVQYTSEDLEDIKTVGDIVSSLCEY